MSKGFAYREKNTKEKGNIKHQSMPNIGQVPRTCRAERAHGTASNGHHSNSVAGLPEPSDVSCCCLRVRDDEKLISR